MDEELEAEIITFFRTVGMDDYELYREILIAKALLEALIGHLREISEAYEQATNYRPVSLGDTGAVPGYVRWFGVGIDRV